MSPYHRFQRVRQGSGSTVASLPCYKDRSHRGRPSLTKTLVDSSSTRILPLELDRRYPLIVRGRGVWLEDAAGRRYLDAMSGGSMAAILGHGRADLVEAARRQGERLAFVHNERLTSPPQEHLARELVGVAPEGFTRVRFVTGGSEANETALRLARTYHVDRGDAKRWRVVSPAQAYHGPTMATLALTGRPGLHGPFGPYLSDQLHIPPSTSHFDPTGEAALAALDRVLEQAGPETVSAFFCEPISAAALPAYSPPARFWEGLAERRERHGFLICFDEVVTGMGRTGHWFAAECLPLLPDIIATAKGLGAGYAAIGAVLCREHVYDAVAAGSRAFSLGHTWDGAPLSCAVGAAVLDVLRSERLVERVHERGPRLREQLEEALGDVDLVREVRGHGYLLGVEYADPRDGESFLPPELRVAGRIDAAAFERELVTLSTQPTRDGYAGDQSLFAPPFVTTDEELAEMVTRFAESVREVATQVERELAGHAIPSASRP
jgi:adenosylmethionine-8-amino-7-oxononanoate aminotransferase